MFYAHTPAPDIRGFAPPLTPKNHESLPSTNKHEHFANYIEPIL